MMVRTTKGSRGTPDTRRIQTRRTAQGSKLSVRSGARRGKPAGGSTSTDRGKQHPLGREVWLETARWALIEEGTAGVEINKLAKRLGVSRGGFYWFFKDRAQLLEDLLALWVQTSTVLFEAVLQGPNRDGMEKYRAMTRLWIDEQEYDPKWDGAVRDWARTSEAVRKVVQAVDQKRIAVLERIFHDIGYRGKEAHIRARVMYYHQVGYYAMGVQESQKDRHALIPYYQKVLTGRGA